MLQIIDDTEPLDLPDYPQQHIIDAAYAYEILLAQSNLIFEEEY